MDKDDKTSVASLLKDAFDVDDAPIGSLFSLEEPQENKASSEQLFTPLTIVSLPQSFINREGRRVDVCGDVDSSTKEYQEGYRYYSSNLLFFRQDGSCLEDISSPNDLTSRIREEEVRYTTKPYSALRWVHPRHYLLRSFFEALPTDKGTLKEAGYYLNRMGFVIEIVGKAPPLAEDDDATYLDSTGKIYSAFGIVFEDASSMYDLRYEIIDWPMFEKADWSTENFEYESEFGRNEPPQYYNPVMESYLEKKERFYDFLLQASKLAKDLGIDFGYHMNDHNKTKSM